MMIFVIASGLTLVFGLMDVLNFGHGAFIAVGAYLAMTTLIPLAGWIAGQLARRSTWRRLALAMLVAMVGTGVLGWAFERVIIMPVYGQHLKQILITTGGLIVAEQLIHVVWGGDQKPMPLPTALRGAIIVGDVAIEKFRLLALAIGLVVFLAMLLRAQPHQARPADPRRRREQRDGGGAGLPHPPPVRRRVRGGLGAGRARRHHVGALPRDADGRHRQRGDRAGLHRHHHRRLGLGRRLLPRLHPGGADGQLHRLPRAQGGARLQHRADGGHPDVAPAGPLSRGQER